MSFLNHIREISGAVGYTLLAAVNLNRWKNTLMT